MSQFRGIPVVTTGTKYQTEQGFAAIKNGVKARADRQQAAREPKPAWLKARIPSGERFERLRTTVREHRLATIRAADQICCLERGRIVERGTHAELMARPQGSYRHFVEVQERGAA